MATPRDGLPAWRGNPTYFNVFGGAKWTKQVISAKGSHDIVPIGIGGDGGLAIVGANHGGGYQPVELWENLTAGNEKP